MGLDLRPNGAWDSIQQAGRVWELMQQQAQTQQQPEESEVTTPVNISANAGRTRAADDFDEIRRRAEEIRQAENKPPLPDSKMPDGRPVPLADEFCGIKKHEWEPSLEVLRELARHRYEAEESESGLEKLRRVSRHLSEAPNYCPF